MKIKTIICTISFLSFLLYGTASAQNQRDISIKFDIDAPAIFEGRDIEIHSKISDDNQGKSGNGKPSDFESEAFVSKFITWEINDIGDSPDEYKVKFLDFPWTGSINAFKDNPIKGRGKKAKAKVEDGTAEGTIKYTIQFTIRKQSTGETKTFELDPKIRVIKSE